MDIKSLWQAVLLEFNEFSGKKMLDSRYLNLMARKIIILKINSMLINNKSKEVKKILNTKFTDYK